jgi:hypothetical protein
MTIYRLLRETSFDPEAVERLAAAFDDACRSLGLTAGDEAGRERVARTVIGIAQGGERDAARLRERTLEALRGGRAYPGPADAR